MSLRLSQEEISAYLHRWREAVSPFLRDGYKLRVSFDSVILVRKENGQDQDQGWIVHYNLYTNTFRCSGRILAVGPQEDLLAVSDFTLSSVLESLRPFGYLKSTLSLLCSTD